MRWLWLQKNCTQLSLPPWSSFPIQVHSCVRAILSMAVATEVCNGANTLFWVDKWIHGQCIGDLAPHFIALVLKRKINKRTVQKALSGHTWITDIQGGLTVESISLFILFYFIYGTFFQRLCFQMLKIHNSHVWQLSTSGQYSQSLRMRVFFSSYEALWALGEDMEILGSAHVGFSSG